jgi:rhomboid family protein
VFLPVGDSPNPPGTPWVTYLLIAVNVVVYLGLLPLAGQGANPGDPALLEYLTVLVEERGVSIGQARQLAGQISRHDLIIYQYGFKPAQPSVVDVFTAMFLHGGLLHLLGNMLFLWIYGDNVEHRLGKLGYLIAYLATGMAASGGDAILRLDSAIPSVGASGAISGVLGLYFLWFPRNRVRVWVFLFPLFANVIEMPARIVLGIYLIFDNIVPLLFTAGRGGVSHGAHIGGFLAGWVLAFGWDRLALARPERDLRRRPATEPPPSTAQDPAESFQTRLCSGRWEEAAEWFFATPHSVTRRGLGPEEKIQLGEVLAREDHPHAALAAFQRALADHPVGLGRVRAHLGAARVLMDALGNATAAYQHLYSALEEDPSQEEEAEARALLEELSRRVRHLPTDLPS